MAANMTHIKSMTSRFQIDKFYLWNLIKK
jgi:hypothetical protein